MLQYQKNISTFIGNWTYTGDTYYLDEKGYYHYCGRADDMFKSGGNWVSPFEVESAISSHDKVLNFAVVPFPDELINELQTHVKQKIELWKCPRQIVFCDQLPKTATGKIQRFMLRQESD